MGDNETMEELVRRLRTATASQQRGSTSFAPSRRQNKNRAGRTQRKRHNSTVTLQRAGGTTDLQRAIYAPADKALCRTYQELSGHSSSSPEALARFTNDPQGQGTNPPQYSYYPGGTSSS